MNERARTESAPQNDIAADASAEPTAPAPTAAAAATAPSSNPPPLLRPRIDSTDSLRGWTWVALVGLGIGVVMAIFGLPPVDLHTPLHHAGIMDPFCGGTRALRLAARGDLAQSWTYNPLGIVVLVCFATLIVRAVVGITTHRWVTFSIGWTRRRIWVAVIITAFILIALEIRQQSIAPLLMSR